MESRPICIRETHVIGEMLILTAGLLDAKGQELGRGAAGRVLAVTKLGTRMTECYEQVWRVLGAQAVGT